MPARRARPNDARRSSNVLQRDLITSLDTTPLSCPGPSRAQSLNTASREHSAASARRSPSRGNARSSPRRSSPERSGPRRAAWPPPPGRSNAAGTDAPRAPHRRAWGNFPPTTGARARRQASRSRRARARHRTSRSPWRCAEPRRRARTCRPPPEHRRRRVVR